MRSLCSFGDCRYIHRIVVSLISILLFFFVTNTNTLISSTSESDFAEKDESCMATAAATKDFTRKMLSKTIVLEPISGKHVSTIIFSHGLGDTAEGWLDAARYWQRKMKDSRFVLPTAPSIPVTLNGGYVMPAWYDLKGLESRDDESCDGIDLSSRAIRELIANETKRLKDAPRVGRTSVPLVLAGFSQGAALSLYTGVQMSADEIAGIVCMSGYLPCYETCLGVTSKDEKRSLPPTLIAHGNADEVVPIKWAREAHRRMEEHFDTKIPMKTYSDLTHSASIEELDDVATFIEGVLS